VRLYPEQLHWRVKIEDIMPLVLQTVTNKILSMAWNFMVLSFEVFV
jgi:hypothetical protein